MSHDWLSPRHVIVATERGKIIIFEDAELKSSYSLEELTKTEDTELLEKEDGVPKEAGALISYSGGFIASYGRDDVFVFEQLPSEGEEFNFKCIKKIKFPKVESYVTYGSQLKELFDKMTDTETFYSLFRARAAAVRRKTQ